MKTLGFFSRLVTRLTTGVSDRESDLAQGMAITLQRLKADAEAGAASNDGVSNDGAHHSDIRTDRSHKG